MARNVEEHIIRLKDEMSGKLGKIQSSIDKMRGSMNGIQKSTGMASSSMGKLGSAIKGVGIALAAAKIGEKIISFGTAAVNTGREFENLQNKLDFATGGVVQGGAAFEFASGLANKLGLNLKETVRGYTDLQAAAIGTAFSSGEVKNIFESVSKAATVLHLDAQRTGSVFLALEQMMSKGTVSMEELRRQLGNSLPGALSIAARSIGKTQQEFNKMVENGELLAHDLLPALAKELDKTFGPGLEVAINSSQAQLEKFKNSITELKAEMGEALLPTVNKVLDSLTRLFQRINDGTGNRNALLSLFGPNSSLVDAAQGKVNAKITEKTSNRQILSMQDRLSSILSKAKTDKQFEGIPATMEKFAQQQSEFAKMRLKTSEETLKSTNARLKEMRNSILAGIPGTDANNLRDRLKSQQIAAQEEIAKEKGLIKGLNDFLGTVPGQISKFRNSRDLRNLQESGGGKDKKGKVKKKGLRSGISEIRAQTPKNITINIGSLIKENNNVFRKDQNKSDARQIEKVLTDALVRVVNDATTINEK